MRLLEFLRPEETISELRPGDKAAVVKELLGAVRRTRAFAAKRMPDVFQALLAREELGSTGIGGGVALPHAKHNSVRRMTGVLGRSREGVDFAALDGEPVYILFLLVSPVDKPDEHLRAMQKLSRMLRDRDYCRFLRKARDREELIELLQEADERFQDE